MNRNRGYSLIELMVAITLGLVLLAGIVQIFVNSKQGYQVQQSTGRAQENTRFAVEYLNRYITLADFWSTLKPSVNTGSITFNTAPTGSGACKVANWIVDPATGIKGYDGQSASSGFSDTALGSCIGSLTNSAGSEAYVPNSDVLVIRYVNPDCYLPTTSGSSSSSGGSSGSSSGGSSSGSAIATISAPPAAPAACSTASGIYWLRTQIGVNGVLFNINSATDVTAAKNSIGGDAPNGVLNYQYQANIFFLANVDNGQGQTPTLYMATLQNPAGTAQTSVQLYLQPLIDGVEMLKFEYGIDPTYGQANDNLSVSKYLPAGSVTNWAQVLSVRASMIVRGDTLDNFQDSQSYQMTNAFTYGATAGSSSGSASYAGSEKYQRRLIVKDFLLRNKVRGP
ncbi:PilW family protein [Nevskia soli]|uniref:PilW family protein n=1 Tax=Nevskia soli TaxID=418856 RepID=UPI0004A7558F|nr:PilW family protein [Nevskia soli]